MKLNRYEIDKEFEESVSDGSTPSGSRSYSKAPYLDARKRQNILLKKSGENSRERSSRQDSEPREI